MIFEDRIRNEKEYQEVLRRIKEDKKVLKVQEQQLKKLGYTKEEIDRVLAPLISFHYQLVEEVEWYERFELSAKPKAGTLKIYNTPKNGKKRLLKEGIDYKLDGRTITMLCKDKRIRS